MMAGLMFALAFLGADGSQFFAEVTDDITGEKTLSARRGVTLLGDLPSVKTTFGLVRTKQKNGPWGRAYIRIDRMPVKDANNVVWKDGRNVNITLNGKPLELLDSYPKYSHKPHDGGYRETILLGLTEDELRRVVRGSDVVIHVGAESLKVSPEHHEAFRLFLAKSTNARE